MEHPPVTSLHANHARAIVLDLLATGAPVVEVELALDQALETSWEVGRQAGLQQATYRKDSSR